jgi:hypothetical protein
LPPVIDIPAAQAELPAQKPDIQMVPADFSTKGKPTKTIETPWGPREIYDPAQDEEVRAYIYSGVEGYLENPSFKKQQQLNQRIGKVKLMQHKDLLSIGCQNIKFNSHCTAQKSNETFSSNTGVRYICTSFDHDSDTGKKSLTINDELYLENEYSFTDSMFRSSQFSLEDIFAFQCLNWEN